MRKEIIDEIIKQPHICFGKTAGFTSDEKVELFEAMGREEMSRNTLYQRMMYRGFDAWELSGIDRCLADFWEMSRKDDSPTPGISDFWQAIVERGLNTAFIKYMEVLGMSRNTTIKRFTSPDFKPWEMDGIEQILRRIEKE